jgi:hypothetical protein
VEYALAVPSSSPPPAEEPIEVLPVAVISKVFTARPSAIPEIREFVRQCLAESPLTDHDNSEVSQIVYRALLDAAGPEGTIQVSFRLFPEHVEVDVLHGDGGLPPGELPEPVPRTFAEWMSEALRREGLTHQAAARQLGVSVKTVSRWVGGETEPRLRELRRIQERFGELHLP